MQTIKQSQTAVAKAVAVLKSGGVVICPTDTVYGFLADASSKKAIEKIYKIKKRPKSKPLPVFVVSIKMAKEIADINKKQEMRLRKFWPGAYTFVLPKKKGGTIALRIPKHPFLQKLLKKVNRPLVQTSVNISAQAPLNSPEQIMGTFGKNRLVGLIVDGGSVKNPSRRSGQAAKPSKIIDLSKEKVVTLR